MFETFHRLVLSQAWWWLAMKVTLKTTGLLKAFIDFDVIIL